MTEGVNAAMLHAGLIAQVLDDTRPARRCRPVARIASDRDDPTTGWPPDPLGGAAACAGKHEVFDKALNPRTRSEFANVHLWRDNAARICRGCPVRERCPESLVAS